MDYDTILGFASEALLLCLMLSLPAVLTSSIVGILVAFVSAITSLQDQSISQGLKLLAVTVVVVIAAPWAGSNLVQFSNKVIGVLFK